MGIKTRNDNEGIIIHTEEMFKILWIRNNYIQLHSHYAFKYKDI